MQGEGTEPTLKYKSAKETLDPYLLLQRISMAPRMEKRNLSEMANTMSAILAPAIAPLEDGRQDLKNRLSPPVKWRYGVIVSMREVEVSELFISMFEWSRREEKWVVVTIDSKLSQVDWRHDRK